MMAGSFHFTLLIHKIAGCGSIGRFAQKHSYGKKRKLVPLSRLTNKELDSVAVEKRHYEDRRAFDVLLQAQQYWNNLSNFRRERERNKNYTFGKQWSDMVTVDGQTMTEEAYIQSQGVFL